MCQARPLTLAESASASTIAGRSFQYVRLFPTKSTRKTLPVRIGDWLSVGKALQPAAATTRLNFNQRCITRSHVGFWQSTRTAGLYRTLMTQGAPEQDRARSRLDETQPCCSIRGMNRRYFLASAMAASAMPLIGARRLAAFSAQTLV